MQKGAVAAAPFCIGPVRVHVSWLHIHRPNRGLRFPIYGVSPMVVLGLPAQWGYRRNRGAGRYQPGLPASCNVNRPVGSREQDPELLQVLKIQGTACFLNSVCKQWYRAPSR